MRLNYQQFARNVNVFLLLISIIFFRGIMIACLNSIRIKCLEK
jgi:hypothetical protein